MFRVTCSSLWGNWYAAKRDWDWVHTGLLSIYVEVLHFVFQALIELVFQIQFYCPLNLVYPISLFQNVVLDLIKLDPQRGFIQLPTVTCLTVMKFKIFKVRDYVWLLVKKKMLGGILGGPNFIKFETWSKIDERT